MNQPSHAKVVIIGAGLIGCSAAYHLAKQGIKDVVVLERKKISSGTSWHAAGILSEMRSTAGMVKMAKETTNMFRDLEKETGHSMNFKRTGSVFITSKSERMQQFKMMLSMFRSLQVEAHEISIAEAKDKWPLIDHSDLVGAIWAPNDALVCPQQATIALSKGAKLHGAQIFEDVKVNKIRLKNNRACGVETNNGLINAEYVVVTTGIWSRDFLSEISVNVPLHAMEHYYILTEQIKNVDPMLPLLRDYDARCYVRPTMGTRWHDKTGHLMLGFFEREGKPWGMNGIPEDFEFGRLEGDREHMERVMEPIKHRIPAIKNTKIETLFCGPESFTYDNNYILGESQTVKNLLLATGFNSRGLQSSGGAGKYISEWITHGVNPNRYDTSDMEAIRVPGFTANRKYLHDKSKEILGLMYEISYPYMQMEHARPIRTSPFYERLKSFGACYGENSGWERPNWYSPEQANPQYEYRFGRQNWFENSAAEHMAVRENVGIMDQSFFGKLWVQGPDALELLEWVCGNKIDVPIGKIVYTQMLNGKGGIESDLTVTRTGETEFLIYTGTACQDRDQYYLKKIITDKNFNAVVTDVTSAFAVIGIMGPRSRELIQKLSNADFSNEAFPFGTSRMIDFAYARARATRVTYVGELGWEISLPSEFALAAFDTLMKEGKSLNCKLVGNHAINSLRLDKSYVHWGHDVSPAETPLESNLNFAVKFNKPRDFLGKECLLKQKEKGVTKRLATFKLKDSDPLLYHYESIKRNGKLAGYITSGMFSPYIGSSIGLGFIHNNGGVVDDDYILNANYKINILNQDYDATVSLQPLYDPEMKKIKI